MEAETPGNHRPGRASMTCYNQASHATDQIYDSGDLIDVAYQDAALASFFEDIEHVLAAESIVGR